MIEYVAGFYFTQDGMKVVLIKKNRPSWMADLLNGVGGKIEPGETPYAAMQREFLEETGVDENNWKPLCELADTAGRYKIHFFFGWGDVTACNSMTDEAVSIYNVADLMTLNVIGNLRWLIPMCLDDYVKKPACILNVGGS